MRWHIFVFILDKKIAESKDFSREDWLSKAFRFAKK